MMHGGRKVGTILDQDENKAVYTATEVACGWAGVVINKPDRATMRPYCVSACIEHVI